MRSIKISILLTYLIYVVTTIHVDYCTDVYIPIY